MVAASEYHHNQPLFFCTFRLHGKTISCFIYKPCFAADNERKYLLSIPVVALPAGEGVGAALDLMALSCRIRSSTNGFRLEVFVAADVIERSLSVMPVLSAASQPSDVDRTVGPGMQLL